MINNNEFTFIEICFSIYIIKVCRFCVMYIIEFVHINIIYIKCLFKCWRCGILQFKKDANI